MGMEPIAGIPDGEVIEDELGFVPIGHFVDEPVVRVFRRIGVSGVILISEAFVIERHSTGLSSVHITRSIFHEDDAGIAREVSEIRVCGPMVNVIKKVAHFFFRQFLFDRDEFPIMDDGVTIFDNQMALARFMGFQSSACS